MQEASESDPENVQCGLAVRILLGPCCSLRGHSLSFLLSFSLKPLFLFFLEVKLLSI